MTLNSNMFDSKYFTNSWNILMKFDTTKNSKQKMIIAYALILDSYYILLAKYYAKLKKDKLTKFSLQNKSVNIEKIILCLQNLFICFILCLFYGL